MSGISDMVALRILMRTSKGQLLEENNRVHAEYMSAQSENPGGFCMDKELMRGEKIKLEMNGR